MIYNTFRFQNLSEQLFDGQIGWCSKQVPHMFSKMIFGFSQLLLKLESIFQSFKNEYNGCSISKSNLFQNIQILDLKSSKICSFRK